jgi:hypothetical protein
MRRMPDDEDLGCALGLIVAEGPWSSDVPLRSCAEQVGAFKAFRSLGEI